MYGPVLGWVQHAIAVLVHLQEWAAQQEAIKNEPLEIVYSYWDGTGHRRKVSSQTLATATRAQGQVQQQQHDQQHLAFQVHVIHSSPGPALAAAAAPHQPFRLPLLMPAYWLH